MEQLFAYSSSRLRAFAVITSALLLAWLMTPGRALADSVWIQSGLGNPIGLSNVKVTGVQDGALTFVTAAGVQTSKPLKRIPQITLDDEPAFSAAEEAFAAHDYTAAADNYHKALETTTRDWVKDRSSLRLVEAANKSGNFPAAVAGFLDLLARNPSLAAQNKPVIPRGRPDLVGPVISDVKRASENPNLADPSKQLLLGYLADLYSAQGNVNAANAALAKLGKLGPTDAANAQSRSLAADARLTEARQAFGQRKFARASQILQSSTSLFTDPDQQADALYLLAQSTAAQADSADPNQLKDAALAYMRVVAVCKSFDGRPHVADSLMHVAEIEQKLKNTKDALAIYNQIAAEFKGSRVAVQAERDARRLARQAPAAQSTAPTQAGS